MFDGRLMAYGIDERKMDKISFWKFDGENDMCMVNWWC